MLWRGGNSGRSATRFFFCLLEMRKRIIGNELSCDGLFHFLITVSLRGKGCMDRRAFPFSNYYSLRSKGSMDHTNVFSILSMFYIENTNTKARQTGTNPFMLSSKIANRKTQRGWFGSLFVFLTE